MQGSCHAHPVFKWLWNSCARGRHKFFGWLLFCDRLNTRYILRRKIKILDDYSCILCSCNLNESWEHLFFNCSFSWWCWRLLSISWSQLASCLDRIVDGRHKFCQCIYREIFLICCWAIWVHRNEVIFYGVPISLARWKHLFKSEFSLLLHKARPTLRVELDCWICNFH